MREELKSLGRVVAFEPGDVLRRPGEDVDRVMIVLEGVVRVERTAHAGRAIELYRVEHDEPCVLEVSSALSKTRYPARAVAQTSGTALVIALSRFRRALVDDPELQQSVFRVVSERLLEVMGLLEAVAFGRVEGRLRALLLREMDEHRTVRATHAELAERLGTAREVVSRLLEQLESEGSVALSRGAVTVVAPEALADV